MLAAFRVALGARHDQAAAVGFRQLLHALELLLTRRVVVAGLRGATLGLVSPDGVRSRLANAHGSVRADGPHTKHRVTLRELGPLMVTVALLSQRRRIFKSILQFCALRHFLLALDTCDACYGFLFLANWRATVVLLGIGVL